MNRCNLTSNEFGGREIAPGHFFESEKITARETVFTFYSADNP